MLGVDPLDQRLDLSRLEMVDSDRDPRSAGGDLDPGSVSATGFAWLSGLAVVSTVGAIALFFAGLRRVGPTAASILSTLEPVVTVGLAFVVFAESLGPAQLAGGALVLSAVLAVRIHPARFEKETA